jgi:hypothetical protein
MVADIFDWIDHVQNLPYFERRLKIAHKFVPRVSRFLYKYKSIDEADPISAERLRDLLVRSRLWLSSPADFNDPFDMSARIVANASGKELLERVKALLEIYNLSRRERERRRRILMRAPIAKLESALGEIYDKNKARVGIFSFAGDAKNILMWSHYAKDHTGVCIQFERARDFKTFSGAVSVDYSSEYPEINWVKDFRESLSTVMLRKHEGWFYEKESRIVVAGGAHTYKWFDPKAVVGVILGCRSTAGGRAIIDSILKERQIANLPPVRLYLAQKHNSKYRLVALQNK